MNDTTASDRNNMRSVVLALLQHVHREYYTTRTRIYRPTQLRQMYSFPAILRLRHDFDLLTLCFDLLHFAFCNFRLLVRTHLTSRLCVTLWRLAQADPRRPIRPINQSINQSINNRFIANPF